MASLKNTGRNTALLAHTMLGAALPAQTLRHLPDNAEAYAQGFYAALRELDEAHAELIVIEALPDNNAWSAIADRLRRAACGAGM